MKGFSPPSISFPLSTKYTPTTLAFLTTHVKQPDDGDDWGKRKRVLKYLLSTRSLRLTLSADSLTNIKWYVDALHQTHDDCKGHMGSLLTFGRGATTSSSNNLKNPSKRSTESENIGLYNKTSDILWTPNFLEAQGYNIFTNIVYQDNMSTLSLAINGYVSSSKRTKHIKAKYFFVHHFHNNHELDLQYCPTEQMWADIITKPLQDPKFRSMRAFLMNCPINYSEDPLFLPSPNPTLAPSCPSKRMTVFPLPSLSPTPSPSSAPMKPQVPQAAPSLQGCVEPYSVSSSGREPVLSDSVPAVKKVRVGCPLSTSETPDVGSQASTLDRVLATA
jgi:hypothetical protein